MRALGLLTLLSLTRMRALGEGNDSTRSFRGGGLILGRDCDAACRSGPPHHPPAPAIELEGRTSSYASLCEAAVNLASGLRRSGFAAGDAIGILAGNSPD